MRVCRLPRAFELKFLGPRAALLLALLGMGVTRAQIPNPEEPQGLRRWFDPATAPFIPIPEIDVDPYSGTTLGLIPTWIVADDKAQIRTIIAPDVIYNPYFGAGLRGRLYSFPSDDLQWSVVGGVKQRVEREFDYEFQAGRLRDQAWSFTASVVYDRSGTPHFYGVGNNSLASAETNYTLQQQYVQLSPAWNLTHTLQLSYLLRIRSIEVEPGSLARVPSIETRFPGLTGRGNETLNRLALIYDTRDDTTIPTRGGEYVVYGGAAAKQGIFNTGLYVVAGIDARHLWTPVPGNTFILHTALRCLPGGNNVPFWSLSSLGGDQSQLGEAQPLRGFGNGRFVDRNSFSASVEYRRRVLAIDAMGTHVSVEVTPLIDVGTVFRNSQKSRLSHLHTDGGVGFRGIASPFVVGYVDVGYGSDGAVIFTGINYPF